MYFPLRKHNGKFAAGGCFVKLGCFLKETQRKNYRNLGIYEIVGIFLKETQRKNDGGGRFLEY